MAEPASPPRVASSPRPSRRITWRTIFWVALWAWLLWRLGPHLGAVVGVESGDRATPAFAYDLLDGGAVTSEQLRGKVVLVNFWATWCPPCRVEMPLLQQMAERHAAAGLVVLGLSRDLDGPDKVRAFLAERGITYPVAIVGFEAERTFGGLRGYPTSFLLDRSGRIRHKALGPLAMVSFEPAVRRLLAEAP